MVISLRYWSIAWASLLQWLSHAPFISGSLIRFPETTFPLSNVSESTIFRKSWFFSGHTFFLQQGMLAGWGRNLTRRFENNAIGAVIEQSMLCISNNANVILDVGCIWGHPHVNFHCNYSELISVFDRSVIRLMGSNLWRSDFVILKELKKIKAIVNDCYDRTTIKYCTIICTYHKRKVVQTCKCACYSSLGWYIRAYSMFGIFILFVRIGKWHCRWFYEHKHSRQCAVVKWIFRPVAF